MPEGGHKPFEGVYALRELDSRSIAEIIATDLTEHDNKRLRSLNRIIFFL
jgi:hypothetical protein